MIVFTVRWYSYAGTECMASFFTLEDAESFIAEHPGASYVGHSTLHY